MISLPYVTPSESHLIKVAPTIGTPSSVPSSETCRVSVPVAEIVKLYSLTPSVIVCSLGVIVELFYPVIEDVTVYVPSTNSLLPLPLVIGTMCCIKLPFLL